MHDGIVQLMGAEFAANGLQQVSSVCSFDGSMVAGRFLIPGQLCGLTLVPNVRDHDFAYVYYISDLHLKTQYKEYCKAVKEPDHPAPMSDWIEAVMDSLFSGDFLQDIGSGRDFVILFLGDIADTFASSELFYNAFMRRWDEIDENNRQLFELQEAERQAALQAARHESDVCIVEEYKASHPWTERAKRPLTSYKRTPDEVKAAIQRIEQWERGENWMLDSFVNFTLHSEMSLPSWEIMKFMSLPRNTSLLQMMLALMLPTSKGNRSIKICFSPLVFTFWMLEK